MMLFHCHVILGSEVILLLKNECLTVCFSFRDVCMCIYMYVEDEDEDEDELNL